jgi:hypothetical protein
MRKLRIIQIVIVLLVGLSIQTYACGAYGIMDKMDVWDAPAIATAGVVNSVENGMTDFTENSNELVSTEIDNTATFASLGLGSLLSLLILPVIYIAGRKNRDLETPIFKLGNSGKN